MFTKRYQLNNNVIIVLDKNKNAKVFEKNRNLTAYLNEDALEIVLLLNKGLSIADIELRLINKYNVNCKNNIKQVVGLIKKKKLLIKYDKSSVYSNDIRSTICDIPIINLQIAITGKCNLKCKHCYDYSSRNNSDLPFDKIKDIITQAKSLGVIQIDITGGEPLLRNDNFQIFELLQKNNFETGLFTNGVLLSNDKIDKFIDLEINQFRISLDGFKASHNSFRGRSDAYHKTLNAIQYIKKHTNTDIIVNTIVNTLNKNELMKFLQFLKKMKLKYKIDTIIPQGNALKHNNIILPEPDYCDILSKIYHNKSKYYKANINKLNLNLRLKDYIAKNKYQISCGVGNRILYIQSDGNVKFCPTLPKILGNVYNESIKQIWEGIDRKQREKLQCNNIEHCVYGLICGGGCRSRAYELTGKVDAPDIYECNLLEKIFGYKCIEKEL